MESTFLASMINPSCLSVYFLLSVKKRISGFLFSWKLLYGFGQFSFLHPWSDLARDIKLGSFEEHIVYDP